MKKNLSKALSALSVFVAGLFAGFTRSYASVNLGGKNLPVTGDNSNSRLAIWILIGAGVVIAVCVVVMLARKKK